MEAEALGGEAQAVLVHGTASGKDIRRDHLRGCFLRVFVEIPEFAIEGFLPIESLDGDYEFDEFQLCLRRQPGHSTLSIGDKMEIQVAEVTVEANEITFSRA